jgi:hypothetical protein
MGWAADVTDLEFRTVGLLEVLGALGTHVRMGETDRLAVPLVLLVLTLIVAIARFGHP